MKHLLLFIMLLSSIVSAGAQGVKVYNGTGRSAGSAICAEGISRPNSRALPGCNLWID